MLSNVVSAVSTFFKDSLQSVGVEKITDKKTEILDEKIRNPQLIKSIEVQLCSKYGDCLFYNDFDKYIHVNRTIEKLIDIFYNVGASGIITKPSFVEECTKDFSTTYKGYSAYDYSIVKEGFDFIFENVFRGIIEINMHSDMGKIFAADAMWFRQLSEGQANQNEMLQGIRAMLCQAMNMGLMMNPIKDNFGPTSEKIADFLKKIEGVGCQDDPVIGPEKALLRYQELLADALIVLRGESSGEIEKVICSIKSHMAICYGNLGNVEKAFECLNQISPAAAQESKLYYFVKAVIIVNFGLEDKYKEAEECLNKALELEPNHRRAYLVSRYLMALQASATIEEILGQLDEYFVKTLSENKERELIADYYMYRGFICKEFKEYDLAEKNFESAKEYGYDKTIVDYNLALLYYSMATQELPKDMRIFCVGVDVYKLNKSIDLLRKWLIDNKEEQIPAYIKARMVGIYVSSCVILGIKHELTPLEEYLQLPDLEYEVLRMLIIGAEGVISKTALNMLDEDDALYARIVNKIIENQYSDVQKILWLMSEEERASLPITTIYLILQVSIINSDLETFHGFRKYVTEVDAIGLIDCIDAYAKEKCGDVEAAKVILDKYATSSEDYHILRNIVCFYARNHYIQACERILVRILELLKNEKVHIDDKPDFYSQAIKFLVSHKSKYAKSYVDAIDIESEQMWRLKAYFYEETKDIPRLLDMLTLLYQNTQDYSIGYNEIVCLMKLMKYDIALSKAMSLLKTVHENNIKDRIRVTWTISNLFLLLGKNQESFEWAKKAHELTMDIPGDKSHNAYLARATRVGHVDEALGSIMEYKERHPVVISEWMKEIQVPKDDSGAGLIDAIESVVGHSRKEYEQKEKEFESLYRKGFLPNSTILKRYSNDITKLFIFAHKNKLQISRGNWESIEKKMVLISEHILVDAMTLIVMQRYGCLDAIKGIKNIHICYATLTTLQEIYSTLNYYYVEPILEWLGKADNIIFEPDGYSEDSLIADILTEDILICCRRAAVLEIPFLTIEVLLEELMNIKEYQLPQGVQVVSIVTLCYAVMDSEPEKLSQMLYNLLEDCTFINFNSEAIIEQIKKTNYTISEIELNRFLFCKTDYDMISFANVYIQVIQFLKSEHYEASLDFSCLVLKDALRIWRRGSHYRYISKHYGDEEFTMKAKDISKYLLYLSKGIKYVYGTIPSEIEELFDDVTRKGIDVFSDEVLSKMTNIPEPKDLYKSYWNMSLPCFSR